MANVEILHKDADRRLIVGDNPKVKFAVCASVMSMASPVWNRMFKTPDADAAYTWRDTGVTEFELDEDDPDAFRILLMAAHLRFQDLAELKFLNYEQLGSIAVLCDKYDTAQLMEPWIRLWIENASKHQAFWNMWLGQHTVHLLNIAYVFRDQDMLKNSIRCVGQNMRLEVQTQSYPSSGNMQMLKMIIPDIIGEFQLSNEIGFDANSTQDDLRRIRAETIRELLDVILAVVARYANNMDVQCKNYSEDCDRATVGSLLHVLMKMDLLHLPGLPSDDSIIDQIPSKTVHASALTLYESLKDTCIGSGQGRADFFTPEEDSSRCGCSGLDEEFKKRLDLKWDSMMTKLDDLVDRLLSNSSRNV